MNSSSILRFRHTKLFLVYALLIAAYLTISFITPVDKEALARYGLSVTQAKLLTLTIVLPYIVIWIIALVGYLRLQTYAERIKQSKDGQAFSAIARGVLVLVLWLPIFAVADSFSKYLYTLYPVTTANIVRIDNYLNLFVTTIGLVLLYRGTQKLLPLIKRPTFPASQLIVFGYVAFAALYVLLTLHDPARQVPTAAVAVATYYQPDALFIITLIIPRLIIWLMGLFAVYNIYLYSKHIKGSLYKAALKTLAIGLGSVVVMTIALRCLQSLSSPLQGSSLGFILAFIYLLLILISVGYVLIAKGAQRLQRLEEL